MNPWSFNIRHLRAFVETYDAGTLLAASTRVHMSQPAMTQAIAKLESQIGSELFLRQSDGMNPTDMAHILCPRFLAALAHVDSTRVTSAQARAFIALTKCGSYAQASKKIGLAQASIHRSVSDLELALDCQLVTRRGRGIEITPQGRTISRRLSLAQTEILSGLQEAEILKGNSEGRIVIGAMPLCRARLLPQTIVDFKLVAPNSEVILVEGSHAEMLEPLRDGDLDIMIGALRDPSPGSDVTQEELFMDQPVIVARHDHPLSTIPRNEVDPSHLSQYGWCIPKPGIPLRDRWQSMFEDVGIEPPTVGVQCGSVIAIRQILMKTDYLTILSPDQVSVELEANWLRVIGNAPSSLTRAIGLTSRNGWHPTSAQETFLNLLRRNSKA